MLYVRSNGGAWQVYYIYRDFQGSITHITNSSGTLVQELSYDAWGRLRNPDTQVAYFPSPQGEGAGGEVELFLGRGYTGHEHLQQFGLINMNARLYDPALGRFLSPDPYVQSPDFTQNYNRYSYCLNNPLKYTDENGEFIGTVIAAWLLFSDVGYDIQKYFFPVAIHIDMKQGNERRSIGADVSVGIPQLFPISYRRHWGTSYYWKDYDNMYSGWETRSGGEWSTLGLAYFSCTYYDRKGEEYDQYRDTWKVGVPLFNLQVENDADMHLLDLPGLPHHIASDKYLTSDIRLRLGPIEVGNTTVTGRSYPESSFENGGLSQGGPYGTYKSKDEYNPDQYRAGILYFKIGGFKIGYNSEGIRDKTQNMVHDNWFSTPRFKKLKRPGKWYWEIDY